MSDDRKSSFLSAVVISVGFVLGLACFGWLIGDAAKGYKRLDEFVTVKGLSEREVDANMVNWPVSFTVSDENFGKLQERLRVSREVARQFLLQAGLEAGEISNTPPTIREIRVEPSSDDPVVRPPRYEAIATVLVRSSKIQEVKRAMETCDRLVDRGLLLTGGNRARFFFTGLNQIKPGMIQEANKNARIAAEKFAGDSGAKVGRIRHAVQGPFEIDDIDESSPDRKLVRVVTTVDFYLND